MIKRLEHALNSAKVTFKVEKVEGHESIIGVYINVNEVALAAVGVDEKDVPELLKLLAGKSESA